MNSIVMSSRKAVVARPTQSRKVASKATRRPVMMSGIQVRLQTLVQERERVCVPERARAPSRVRETSLSPRPRRASHAASHPRSLPPTEHHHRRPCGRAIHDHPPREESERACAPESPDEAPLPPPTADRRRPRRPRADPTLCCFPFLLPQE